MIFFKKYVLIADIEAGTIISFYNGMKFRSDHEWEKPTPYKMLLDENYDIDVPDSMTSLQSYSATLGHKVQIILSKYASNVIFGYKN